jgi:hypothetical protein
MNATIRKPKTPEPWELPNARLIAAAPEILESLRETTALATDALDALRKIRHVQSGALTEALRRAKAAIARAEGRNDD